MTAPVRCRNPSLLAFESNESRRIFFEVAALVTTRVGKIPDASKNPVTKSHTKVPATLLVRTARVVTNAATRFPRN
jgi:hypothetical protein